MIPGYDNYIAIFNSRFTITIPMLNYTQVLYSGVNSLIFHKSYFFCGYCMMMHPQHIHWYPGTSAQCTCPGQDHNCTLYKAGVTHIYSYINRSVTDYQLTYVSSVVYIEMMSGKATAMMQ